MRRFRHRRAFVRVFATLAALITTTIPARAASGYLRSPDLHGDQLVFVAEGDLWICGVDGGGVRRLTSHPGDEVAPCFSPDGRWIAFAGDYDGNRDVFVIPAAGGEPERLTWHPGWDLPVTWTPDGESLIFRSTRANPHWNWHLYRVPRTGGDPEELPLGWAMNLSIDPATGRYAFNRSGGGGTWKRYRGGTAADIWVSDPGRAGYVRVDNFDGNDLVPMWLQGKLYFLSDLGGTMNLWTMSPDGSNRRRLTDFEQWDARMPSDDGAGRIVFTLAGDIHLFDLASETERRIPIELPSERTLTRVRYPEAARFYGDFALTPKGDRLALVARGEIYSVPAKEGITLPITRGSGSREDRVGYDSKGERVVYVTDESGEETIVTADAWGRGEPKVVAGPGGLGRCYPPQWSPDGQWVAWADQSHTLWIVPAEGGERRAVDRNDQSEIREYAWSPDGRWLAYGKFDRRDRGDIYIFDTREKVSRRITGWTTDDRTPAWDPEGRYLYFVSDRVINPMIGAVDFEVIELQTSKLCLALLRPDVKNPVAKLEGAPPGADEQDGKTGGRDGKTGGKSKKKEGRDQADSRGKEDEDNGEEDDEVEPIEIDFAGIEDRVIELPIEADRYYGLSATSDKLFYLSWPDRGLHARGGDFPERKGGTLWSFDLEEKESKVFLREVRSYDLQAKKEKIAVRKAEGEFYVLEAGSPPGEELSKSQVKLNDLVIELDPREEWRQMYFEAWRTMRDFYWDPGMHGVDWTAVRDQYATLLPRLATRSDLHDLLAEMIGELATSHTYVWGGDRGVSVPSVSAGLLGADLERIDGAFRVVRIHRGAPADRIRSPLDEPGSVVKEGEYILAVNHRPVPRDRPFDSMLAGLAGKPVLLTVHDKPEAKNARTVTVRAMEYSDALALLYADWVRQNREYVTEKTGGKIGYIHIPDMGGRGMKEFDTWFYNQTDKEGMVVDARWNGGGFVSQLMVSRFLRQLLWWDRARGGGVWTYPQRVLNGPFVVLTNEFAGSDGDIFPAAIKQAGAAPIIGKRSWGGVIGIRGERSLVDGGAVTNPEFAWWHPREGWGIENHGVDPDIVVENLPQDLGRGVDAQLDRAIAEVLRLHQENPPLVPEFGPAPDRSRRAYREREK